MSTNTALYDTDFYAWVQDQAALLVDKASVLETCPWTVEQVLDADFFPGT